MALQFSDLTSPTLLLDEQIARRNLDRIAGKFRRLGIRFRPHFKTPQSAAIGEWFKAEGVTACTVSSLAMVEYFADHGWQDITLAVPANRRESQRLRALSERISLNLLFDDPAVPVALREAGVTQATWWLEIDCGYPRSGIRWDDEEGLKKAAAHCLRDGVAVKGILTHAGHTYQGRGKEEVLRIHDTALKGTLQAQMTLQKAGLADLEVSFGDTPGASLSETFEGVTEMRPGNFLFYDLQQSVIGSCTLEQVAVALFVPIVSVHPERGEVIVHGGAVHLSKDSYELPDGKSSFGAVALPKDSADPTQGWRLLDQTYVRRVTQEHGIVHLGDHTAQFRPGDFLLILPPHSCLAADAMGAYTTLEGKVLTMMR
jgi:D-serine deaminase-like pyridoxal phosphate-dependent protein